MIAVTVGDVNQFFPAEKMAVESVDNTLALTHENVVLGYLRAQFDVTGWNQFTVPPVVKTIVVMLTAADMYGRQYAEDVTDESTYAGSLHNRAMNILQAVLDGLIILDEDVVFVGSDAGIFPTDVAPKFRMDHRW